MFDWKDTQEQALLDLQVHSCIDKIVPPLEAHFSPNYDGATRRILAHQSRFFFGRADLNSHELFFAQKEEKRADGNNNKTVCAYEMFGAEIFKKFWKELFSATHVHPSLPHTKDLFFSPDFGHFL